MDDQLRLVGSHSDWVTQIATTPQVPNMILSDPKDENAAASRRNECFSRKVFLGGLPSDIDEGP